MLRSAALGLRASPGATTRSQVMLGRLFGPASIVAPFAFGTVAGGLARRRRSSVPDGADTGADPMDGAVRLLVGALAVGAVRAARREVREPQMDRSGEELIAERFRRRALASASACCC